MTERRAQGAAPDAFKRDLVAVIPHLRAFARGLCGRPDFADDLVQETMVRAWNARERFRPDTSMKAWTFVILRNAFLSEVRRNRFRGDYDEVAAERITAGGAVRRHRCTWPTCTGRCRSCRPNGARRCCWWVPGASAMKRRPRSRAARSARSRAGSRAAGRR